MLKSDDDYEEQVLENEEEMMKFQLNLLSLLIQQPS